MCGRSIRWAISIPRRPRPPGPSSPSPGTSHTHIYTFRMAIEPDARRRAHQWRSELYERTPEREALFETMSGHPIEPLYTEEDLEGFDPAEKLGHPGEHPFTRGVYPSMY